MDKREIDLTDQIFGKLIVIERETDHTKFRASMKSHKVWYCVCECGSPFWAPTGYLTSGKCTHCGCSDGRKKGRLKLEGQRFGTLIALERDGRIGNKPAYMCKCDCGRYRKVTATQLSRGVVTHCGCKNKSRRGPKSKHVYDRLPGVKPKRRSRLLTTDLSYGLPDI